MSADTTKGINTGAGTALDALSMYQGIKQGGVTGYGQALGAGLQGAGNLLGNTAMSGIGGEILAPLAVYNAIKNWQSGATGADALGGMSAGAAIGSIVPGIGTLIGALGGLGVGALSSAFGGGKKDPETTKLSSYLQQYNKPGYGSAMAAALSPQQNFQNLAGMFDAKNNTAGHSTPLEQYYGRMGEGAFLNDVTGQINNAIKSGQVGNNLSAQDLYSKVVNPYLQSKNMGIQGNWVDAHGNKMGSAIQDDVTNMISQWQRGQITPQTALGISGQKDAGIQAYGGQLPPTPAQTPAQAPPGQQPGALPTTPQPATPPATAPRPIQFGQSYQFGAKGGSMRSSNFGSALNTLGRRKRLQKGGDPGDLQNFTPGGAYYDPPPPPDPIIYTPPPVDVENPGGESGVNLNLPNFDQTSSGSQGSVMDQLKNLWTRLSGQGPKGLSDTANILKGLGNIAAPFLSHPNTNLKAPIAPPGMTQGATAPPSPIMNRTQNMMPSNLPGGASPGGGTAPGTASPPPAMQLSDWYTYGQRPEASFFSNNQLPMTQMTGLAPKARGGALSQMSEFNSDHQNYAQGPGSGTEDKIPAQLSDGEYVMDAGTVSMLGDGSNKDGAAKLDQLRENLRKHVGRKLVKGKQMMQVKPPADYIGKKGQ
jgi:hypothetical protein